ncbi:MAG: hypothetical protein KF752_20080 [Pirellulaceae bacterium]|nr:hypothetical protein [Pirellulaceae bacterium]
MLSNTRETQSFRSPQSACSTDGRGQAQPLTRRRLLMLLSMISLTSLMPGCAGIGRTTGAILSDGSWGECLEEHRNRSCALKAWFRREHNFSSQCNLRDFREGFIAGYMSILEGKPGCTPTVPPRGYWGWSGQTSEGQSQMSAWFAGFPYGVQAAKDDGVDQWSALELSPQFRQKYGLKPDNRSGAGQYSPIPHQQRNYQPYYSDSDGLQQAPVPPSQPSIIDLEPRVDADQNLLSPFPIVE